MIEFVCPRCGTTQRVPDNAAGLKVACVRCSQKLKVPAAPDVRARQTAPPPKPVAVKGGKQWYYHDGDKQCGPVTWPELRRMASEGELSPEDRVWGEGLPGWQAAKLIPKLFPDHVEPPPLSEAEAKGKWLEGFGVFLFAGLAGLALLLFVGYIVWRGVHSSDDTTPDTSSSANATQPEKDTAVLHRALFEMKEARAELKESKHDFGDHRERAMRALERAIDQTEDTLKAVGEGHSLFHRDRDDYKQFKYDNHPHLRHTVVELKEVEHRLEHSHDDLGGHRERLLESIRDAVREVDRCVDSMK
jgi:hypothetical protein